MNIKINGKEQAIKSSLSIAGILKQEKVESPEMVSVQLNGTFVDKRKFEEITLRENDQIDFLYFMGGGGEQ